MILRIQLYINDLKSGHHKRVIKTQQKFNLGDQICSWFNKFISYTIKQIHIHIPLHNHCWIIPSACQASCPSCKVDLVWSVRESKGNTPMFQLFVLSLAPPCHTIAQYIYHSIPCVKMFTILLIIIYQYSNTMKYVCLVTTVYYLSITKQRKDKFYLYPSAWADQRNCQGGYLVKPQHAGWITSYPPIVIGYIIQM